MTYRCTELTLTALLTLTCSVSLGCDAPEKTVGQETDGGTESGSGSGSGSGSDSGSDTQNCGGVLPCGTNATDSDSGSESGTPGDCEAIDNAPACAAEGCSWQDTFVVSIEGAACNSSETGHCFEPESADECPAAPCQSDNREHWVQDLGDGTSELLSGDCFQPVPAGFTRCVFDGSDPADCFCACQGDGAGLPDGFESTLSASGCSDMSVYGSTPDGSIGLVLSTGQGFDPVAAAVEAGVTTTTTHDVSEFSRLSVLVGVNVTYLECNDAIDESAYEIQQEWVATAGTVELTITPEMDAPEFDTQGFATVTITDLEVTFADVVTEALDTVTFEDVAVGWLPG